MAITLGAEVALAVHMDQALTYGEIESALVDAGFTSYTIMRSINYDGSCDTQVFVRSEPASDGSTQFLPAVDTLTMLSTALSTMQDAEPEPDPEAPVSPDAPVEPEAPVDPEAPADGGDTGTV